MVLLKKKKVLNKNHVFLTADKNVSIIFLGNLYAVGMIGPILGFSLGSLFSKMYVDIGFVDLSKYNQNKVT